MKDIIFATNNAHKLKELREIAAGKLNVLSLNDIGCVTVEFRYVGSYSPKNAPVGWTDALGGYISSYLI